MDATFTIARDRDVPPVSDGKPSQLGSVSVMAPEPKPLQGWMARHGHYPKGTVLPETRVQVCPRKPMSSFRKGFIPARYYERNLEQNQQVAPCCRHPENMSIAGFKSHPEEQAPDNYVLYCDGLDEMGRRHHQEVRQHRVFLMGEYDKEGERRPVWK